MEIIASGAEAVITLDGKNIIKTRVHKRYRLKEIDEALKARQDAYRGKTYFRGAKMRRPNADNQGRN